MAKNAFPKSWKCRRLSNGTVEVFVTTGVGPRIIGYNLKGRENILGLAPTIEVKSGLGTWKAYGGHRLWAAPEVSPRTVAPDNGPIGAVKGGGRQARFIQRVDAAGLEKQVAVVLDRAGSGVTVHHRITNRNQWDIDLAPWALSIMNGGGTAIVPQEPWKSHDEQVLPARQMTLWAYTDLSDRRYAIGPRFLRLSTDSSVKEPTKVGVANKRGWTAYLRNDLLFVKIHSYNLLGTYPDYGCNTELYTAGDFIEVETLGPMARLCPGACAEHTERWHLFSGVPGVFSEEALAGVIGATLRKLKVGR
jgi:hypothetical protein